MPRVYQPIQPKICATASRSARDAAASVRLDGIGQDIQEVQRMHEKHTADMQLFCFETELVIADAVKRYKELALEMDEK